MLYYLAMIQHQMGFHASCAGLLAWVMSPHVTELRFGVGQWLRVGLAQNGLAQNGKLWASINDGFNLVVRSEGLLMALPWYPSLLTS